MLTESTLDNGVSPESALDNDVVPDLNVRRLPSAAVAAIVVDPSRLRVVPAAVAAWV